MLPGTPSANSSAPGPPIHQQPFIVADDMMFGWSLPSSASLPPRNPPYSPPSSSTSSPTTTSSPTVLLDFASSLSSSVRQARLAGVGQWVVGAAQGGAGSSPIPASPPAPAHGKGPMPVGAPGGTEQSAAVTSAAAPLTGSTWTVGSSDALSTSREALLSPNRVNHGGGPSSAENSELAQFSSELTPLEQPVVESPPILAASNWTLGSFDEVALVGSAENNFGLEVDGVDCSKGLVTDMLEKDGEKSVDEAQQNFGDKRAIEHSLISVGKSKLTVDEEKRPDAQPEQATVDSAVITENPFSDPARQIVTIEAASVPKRQVAATDLEGTEDANEKSATVRQAEPELIEASLERGLAEEFQDPGFLNTVPRSQTKASAKPTIVKSHSPTSNPSEILVDGIEESSAATPAQTVIAATTDWVTNLEKEETTPEGLVEENAESSMAKDLAAIPRDEEAAPGSFKNTEVPELAQPVSYSTTPSSSSAPSLSLSTQVSQSPDAAQNHDLPILLHTIASRERQLLTATEDNAHLRHTVDSLRNDVTRLERDLALALDMAGSGSGSVGIGRSKADDEASRLRQELEVTRAALASKCEEAAQLLAEGQALSQKEVRATNALRKAREDARESEKRFVEAERERDQSRKEAEEVREAKERVEREWRKAADSLKSLTELHTAQTNALLRLESELTTLKDEKLALQQQVERTWAELAEARRVAATQLEDRVREEVEEKTRLASTLADQLANLQRNHDAAEAAARRELTEMKQELKTAEEEWGWKEDNLRKEIASLLARLHSSDLRAESLASAAQESTRPLLRQIDALQAAQQAAQANWEAAELALAERVREAESERAVAVERERAAREREGGLTTRIASLEAQLSTERQDKARVSAELDVSRRRASSLDRKSTEMAARLATLESAHARELEDARESYHSQLRQQIRDAEQTWERKRREEDREKIRGVESRRSSERNRLRLDIAQKGGGGSGRSSPHDSILSFHEGGGPNGHLTSLTPAIDVAGSVFGSPVVGVNSHLAVERLSIAVKSLESQVGSLQAQLKMAMKTRDELAEELVKGTTENERLREEVLKAALLRREFTDLSSRHDAALVLLGEKTETVEELKADIADMKVVFREQLENLLAAQQQEAK
ncbi:hypothetical protein HDU93_008740 [Gonapodya sp. JEL0774]|nr:hypothetical protein HDU93_008740 [Gonapodya sp. JEL0774]